MMKTVELYWRRVSTACNELWEFRFKEEGIYFSTSRRSCHKKRRPERVFIRFAVYRPKNHYIFKAEKEIRVDERIVLEKIIK